MNVCLHELGEQAGYETDVLCLEPATVVITVTPKGVSAWVDDPVTAYRCDDHWRAAKRAFTTPGRYDVAVRRLPL